MPILSRPSFASVATAAFAALLLVSACSSPDADPSSGGPSPSASGTPAAPSADPSASPSTTVQASPDLSGIEVVDGDPPQLKFSAPWAIANTTTKVLTASEGSQKVTKDSVVTVNYVGVNGSTGEVFDSSYEAGTSVTLSLAQVVPGFRLGLEGQVVGSRVLIGMPSSDGYPEGQGDKIKPGDSLLFVIDILSANFEEATGEAQPPVAGLPTVSVDDDGVPTAQIDTAAQPPKELQTATLIKGGGPAVAEESVIQVKYRSWVWDTGAEFEDAWAPQPGRLSGLIEGWKKGLVGQTAGSRVLLVVPPGLAYPEGRTTSPALPPGKTLVYVIDILDVQSA